jgi:alcohol dehydrogenase class IV
MTDFEKAQSLLQQFKGNSYLFGTGVLPKIGRPVAAAGKNAALVRGTFPGSDDYVRIICGSLTKSGVNLVAEIKGARPNCPREDLFRIADSLRDTAADVVISFGGGSTIDAVKAAQVLRTLGGDIDAYFGTALVTKALQDRGKSLTPHVAVQTVASSAAHLTKYSNITDLSTGQKKLIVDDAIVPPLPVFDYEVTYSTPPDLTADGALDGISHSLEVLYGAAGKSNYEKIEEVAAAGISLAVNYLPKAIDNPADEEARVALCLAADLGGYSIMIGGTNGGHLTSFSLVDILPHGRACGIMNPYYTVFFAPAIERPLRVIGKIYQQAGLIKTDVESPKARDLGLAVAEGMFNLARKINYPTRLSDVDGFSPRHIERALSAAKNPQLEMKLRNMPIPLTADMIDEYMAPILHAAQDGNLALIKNV